MNLFASIIIVAFSLFLISLTVLTFANPAVAERFFISFASSARAHYIEQAFRLFIGSSLLFLAPAMWNTNLFRLIGWAIVIPSIVLILTPWQWHHRFGERVLPYFVRYMRVFAIGIFAFGVLLLYGVFVGQAP
jgi:hypothetical protein